MQIETLWIDGNERRVNLQEIRRLPAANGVRYPHDLTVEQLTELGYREITISVRPDDFSDETYYRTEQDDAPYVVYTQKSPKQLKQVRNQKRKERIARIEDRQSLRAIREALLSGDKTKLQEIEDQVIAVRGELEVEE